MKTHEFSLKKNAIDSLEEALDFLEKCKEKPEKIRIAILLFDNFMELFLKTYISSKHPLLILRKPSDKNSETITLNEAISLIQRLDYQVEGVFEKEIVSLRKLRNFLQHYQAQLSPLEWEERIGKIIYYVLNFDEKNDNLFDIKKHITEKKWNEIIHYKEIFEKHWNSSKNEAKDLICYDFSELQPECPKCQLNDTTHIEEGQTAYCHFCREHFPIKQCEYCGKEKNLSSFDEDEKGRCLDICQDCWMIRVEND